MGLKLVFDYLYDELILTSIDVRENPLKTLQYQNHLRYDQNQRFEIRDAFAGMKIERNQITSERESGRRVLISFS